MGQLRCREDPQTVGAGVVRPLKSHELHIKLQADDEVRSAGADGVGAAVQSGTMQRAVPTGHSAGSGSVTAFCGVGETKATI
ncbi:hypothetical protein NDU88_003663 [Pleurodeles waltl]|uniref:Uncharacterized protein n=1 Tax=Pleurodeles waltl TaxID=8319 RepID=A0AAV7WSY6_PLEWA|nr:hypothetical protein NDU88_003663 [Pleurodeles waltl]